MKLKQRIVELGLALVAAGLLAAQAQAADAAVEPLELGAALALAGAEVVVALEQPVTAAAVGSSGPLGVEGSAALAAFSQADIATLFEPSAAPLQLAALSELEMKETDGAFAPLPFLAWSLGGAAASSWIHHGRSIHRTGHLGSSRGAAWAAGAGFLGGIHGRGLAAGAGVTGFGRHFLSAQGAAVSSSLNFANPWRR